YRALLAASTRTPSRADASPSRRDERRERAEVRAALAPLRKRAKDAESRIAQLTDERAQIEARLAQPSMYGPGRMAEMAAANVRLAAIAGEIESAESEWLAAAEALEVAL
ncbi:MAG: ABC transporter ATP-binding protein, partial [Acetobacteraceae bacterium]|nr:ABC transporter ATP-binding protein [Acetobacteraceae bacterium]